ncbi:MAG TPA: lipid-A-disaccharide synthase [Verrucomicrobiae bacterium]|jgi:lipid-A-disaccharide synthase|nr:lipid-A-disaccharide synthase [Verrucomicrobiae bacterium]
MTPRTIMIVAGDPSGDALAADLIRALQTTLREPARFIGAGGPRLAAAGVALEFDLTQDAVIGLSDVLQKLPRFRRRLQQLAQLAAAEKPELVILVDFSGFNRRLARAIRERAAPGWRPKIAQYVSPQVWASRPGRADAMARDFDLLLCLFPFEQAWYAQRTPQFRVEWVGHPMFDRHGPVIPKPVGGSSVVALLPGSRRAELTRHLPVIGAAARLIQKRHPAQFKMALPNEEMAALARTLLPPDAPEIEIVIGQLEQVLRAASVAIASTGTVTLECAYFGVPTVALYKTSWSTYWIGRQIVKVKFLAMPNLLANRAVFPELIQGDATGEKIARATLALLEHPERRRQMQAQLGEIVATLGGPGASERAAQALAALLDG